jgi:hypothetical protein
MLNGLIYPWGVMGVSTEHEEGVSNGAFTLDVKSMLSENLGGILGGTQC